MNHDFKGTHILVEVYDLDKIFLTNLNILKKIVKYSLLDSKIEIVGFKSHKFEDNQGYTFVYLLAESHFSIHTYPEHNSAFIDIFTCGDTDPEIILNRIVSQLNKNTKIKKKKIIRG